MIDWAFILGLLSYAIVWPALYFSKVVGFR